MPKFTFYISLLLVHVGIGVAAYTIPLLSKVYFFGSIIFFLVMILRTGNKNNEALMAAAYMAGGEVFFRMTGAAPIYEAGKYSVIAFILIGLFLSGTSKKSSAYWFFLLLLIPGIYIASQNVTGESDFRNSVVFNLSGPFCLAISALYCVDRKLSYRQLQVLGWAVFLPILSMAVYLTLYTPDLRAVLTGTGASFEASGGFGPNQVSTVLGLGMFFAVVQLLTNSKTKLLLFVHLFLVALMSYRAIVTFSRGGVWTALLIIGVFIITYFSGTSSKARKRISTYLVLVMGVAVLTWAYSSFQTNGLIGKRYANQDAAGRVKGDVTTGRVDLLNSELNAFYENPVTGVGVGQIKDYREEATGKVAASHNEVSRMLSEHGILGVVMLGILGLYPLVYRSKNKRNYLFYSALGFWFLTINHSSMRIAAPAFIYALALLNIVHEKKKIPLRRQRLSPAR